MKNVLATLWNALALAAIGFTIWSGYQLWHSAGTPPSGDRVDVGLTIIEAVRHVNKQVFIEHYTGAEIRSVDVPEGWLKWLGEAGVRQEYLILVRGRVPAGFDLSKLSSDDIWVSSDGQRAQINLPAPQIFAENVALDLANSRILENANFCPGFICQDDRLSNFQQEVEPEAKQRLISAAEEAGILSQAAADAEVYYEQLLNGLGIAEVRVIIPGYTVAQR